MESLFLSTFNSQAASPRLFSIENILKDEMFQKITYKIDANKQRLTRYRFNGPRFISWNELTLEQKKIHLFCFDPHLNRALNQRFQLLNNFPGRVNTNSRIYRQHVYNIRFKMRMLQTWINSINERTSEVIRSFFVSLSLTQKSNLVSYVRHIDKHVSICFDTNICPKL